MSLFLNEVRRRSGIVFYGIGKKYIEFEGIYKGTIVEEKSLFCIDNDSAKQGSEVKFGEKDIIIYPEKYLYLNGRNSIVVVMPENQYELVKKLQEELRELNIIVIDFDSIERIERDIDSYNKEIPANIHLNSEMTIPKVIHYCWFGGNPIPERYKKWMNSWKEYCPDYEIIEWNEKNYDITKNQYMQKAYEYKKWGFVPDYARLDIIYNYGGIYLDTDVELIANMDDLLYQDGFVGFQAENYVNFGNGFGAIKGLDLIRYLRDCYNSLDFGDRTSMNLIPSPVFQTNSLTERGLLRNGEYQIIDGMTIFPEKMFCGKSLITGMITCSSYTHSIHHFDASWLDDTYRNNRERIYNIRSTFLNRIHESYDKV